MTPIPDKPVCKIGIGQVRRWIVTASADRGEDNVSRPKRKQSIEPSWNIEKRFQALPNDVLLSPAIQNLKKSLPEYIDRRLPRTPPNNSSPPRSSTPSEGQPSPTPDPALDNKRGSGYEKRRLDKPGVNPPAESSDRRGHRSWSILTNWVSNTVQTRGRKTGREV